MSNTLRFSEVDPPHTEQDKLRIANVEHAYLKEDRKLFHRKILENISEILVVYRKDRSKVESPTLEIPDFVDGDKSPYTINLNLGPRGDESFLLKYIPIQMLINPYWYRIRTCFTDIPNPIKNMSEDMVPRGRKGDLSSEEFAEFENVRDKAHRCWKTNAARDSVIKTFQVREVEKQLKKITKIIAFGNGSLWHVFSADKEDWDCVKTVAQHAVIAEMRTYINEMFNLHVRTCAQDPRYAPIDVEECLGHFGIEQMHDPDGILEIDGGTLVFSMKPDFPLLQLIADMALAQPPIIFHDEIKRNENWQDYKDAASIPDGRIRPKKGIEPNPTSPRVEKFIRHYKEYSINDPDDLLRGNKTKLYILEEGQV